MKYFVTTTDREAVVTLDGDRAIVEIDGESMAFCLTALPPFLAAKDRREIYVRDQRNGNGERTAEDGLVATILDPVARSADTPVRVAVANGVVEAVVETERDRLRRKLSPEARSTDELTTKAPLTGIIGSLFRFPGNDVETGDVVLTLEAMKMENEIRADLAGRVAEIHVSEGDVVNVGDPLFTVRATGE